MTGSLVLTFSRGTAQDKHGKVSATCHRDRSQVGVDANLNRKQVSRKERGKRSDRHQTDREVRVGPPAAGGSPGVGQAGA